MFYGDNVFKGLAVRDADSAAGATSARRAEGLQAWFT